MEPRDQGICSNRSSLYSHPPTGIVGILEVSMPLVKVYLDKGSQSAQQRAELARKITDLIVKETGMPQQYTWVMIHEVPEEDWIVDRLTVTELKTKLSGKKK